jgi:hypothetical protein
MKKVASAKAPFDSYSLANGTVADYRGLVDYRLLRMR